EPNFRTRNDPLWYSVRINQDFYQRHATLDPARYPKPFLFADTIDPMRELFLLPYFGRADHPNVLVLGAGGGPDAEAALLAGASHVDAVEIDRTLVQISRRMSPSAVYEDPRVTVHVDDARAFLQRSRERYGLIVFGYLDSQSLFSYGSSLRQDSYVYTVE